VTACSTHISIFCASQQSQQDPRHGSKQQTHAIMVLAKHSMCHPHLQQGDFARGFSRPRKPWTGNGVDSAAVLRQGHGMPMLVSSTHDAICSCLHSRVAEMMHCSSIYASNCTCVELDKCAFTLPCWDAAKLCYQTPTSLLIPKQLLAHLSLLISLAVANSCVTLTASKAKQRS